ncbi:MAG: hypothetical protein HOP16_02980 [Acidobacteria bacterium]|nr:hypothetical protein [Acidobacteriota bacterium]
MKPVTFWRSCAASALCLASVATIAATGAGSEASVARPGPLPSRLSETGLYSDASSLTVDPRHLAFSPQYPLWTDGAQKRRWVSLPAGTAIDITDIEVWSFPVGTRFWKEFSFGGRRVETRMLVKSNRTDWQFASYAWNDTQTDAVLAPVTGLPGVAEIAPGKKHSIPSVEDCRACHDSSRTEVLGFSALQLSDDRDANAIHGEPLVNGMVTLRTLLAANRLQPGRPELVSAPPRIPAASSQERAVLGYLSTNCGACHNSNSTLAPLKLMFKQPAYGGGLGVVRAGLVRQTKWDRPGAVPETTSVIDPVVIEHSALLYRMRSRRPASQMPPLGSVTPDAAAVDHVTRWALEEFRRP